MMNKIDNLTFNNKWEFNEEVASCFGDMITRSVPQYHIIQDLIIDLIDSYISNNNIEALSVVDLGCSNGLMIKKLCDNLKNKLNKLSIVGIDNSEPMIKEAKEFLKTEIDLDLVKLLNADIMNSSFCGKFNIITSVLTLQFVPTTQRPKIVKQAYKSLKDNGIFIMVEKVIAEDKDIDKILVDNYYKLKYSNGYTKEQVESKRQSLDGVMTPMTSSFNKELLKQAGFTKIDSFWRYLNFEGYIAIK